MWPGQQPPGGEQNPQDQNPNPNPYQQPGYGQQPNPTPNPYQQPGYGQQQPGYPPPQQGYPQPNPYQQPTVPVYGQPGPPGPPDDNRRKTRITAIVAVLAVLIAAGVTGFLVLGKDGDSTSVADSKSSPSPTHKPSPTVSQDNPRDGSAGAKPQIAGWKVVTNPEHGTLFDVPPDWEVQKPGVISGFEDAKKGDGTPYISFSAPAYLKSKWCTSEPDASGQTSDTSLAGTGTKGGQGAKDTATASYNEAGAWVFAAYAQQDPNGKTKIKVAKAKPYTTTSGLTGSYATAESTGITKKTKCDTDGKSVAFTFSNAKGDFTTWVMYANTGVTGEVPDATMMKVLSTVRLSGPTS